MQRSPIPLAVQAAHRVVRVGRPRARRVRLGQLQQDTGIEHGGLGLVGIGARRILLGMGQKLTQLLLRSGKILLRHQLPGAIERHAAMVREES